MLIYINSIKILCMWRQKRNSVIKKSQDIAILLMTSLGRKI